VHVKSTGVPPQMFRDNIGVVVEGTMTRGGSFSAPADGLAQQPVPRAESRHPTTARSSRN
jgi:hypothetical protein